MNSLPLLEDLKLFCNVARNLSFIATATELGVSPAYVSKRVALLEKNMQVQLLRRTTRKVVMTEDGEKVLRWSQQILEDVEQMVETVGVAKSVARGTLRISTSVGFGRKQLAPILSRLAFSYPQLRIQLELFDRAVDLISEGFDLDIRIGGKVEPNLITRKIAENRRVLCAAPAYLEKYGSPQKLEDLENHSCIFIRERDQGFGVWRLESTKGEQAAIKVDGPMASNSGEIAHQWALDGHGIILRSAWDVQASLEQGALVRILPDYSQQADIVAVYPQRLNQSAKVRVCVELLLECLGKGRN